MAQSIECQPSIFSQTPEVLRELIAKTWSLPKFRADQVIQWIFEKRVLRLESMKNIPKDLRNRLSLHFDWTLPEIVSRLDGEDGATKLLLRGAKNQVYEAVILRYDGRTSLCVSSQVGCKLACDFCQTGKLGFFRHLSAGEIVGQFLLANEIVSAEGKKISHIVFMGMGEPFDNFEQVCQAVHLFTSSEAYGISARRVTVSTSGVAPRIGEFAKRVRAGLAVSLHAARDDLRTELMPINRRYPVAVLKSELLKYQRETGDKITIEYILIHNKNCGNREAKELVTFLHGLKAKVNLIPFNAHPGMPFQRPEEAEILQFQSHLTRSGYPAPVRYSKGLDVSAACGQLAAKYEGDLGERPLRKRVVNAVSAAEATLPS